MKTIFACLLFGVTAALSQEMHESPIDKNSVIPEFLSYKSVRIRRVEPDGISIIHESGTAKIAIEKLTPEQRKKYGITLDGAAKYREQVALEKSANESVDLKEAARVQAEALAQSQIHARAREQAEEQTKAKLKAATPAQPSPAPLEKRETLEEKARREYHESGYDEVTIDVAKAERWSRYKNDDKKRKEGLRMLAEAERQARSVVLRRKLAAGSINTGQAEIEAMRLDQEDAQIKHEEEMAKMRQKLEEAKRQAEFELERERSKARMEEAQRNRGF